MLQNSPSDVPMMLLNRRNYLRALLFTTATTMASGCVSPWFSREEKSEMQKKGEEIQEMLESEDRPRLLGDLAYARHLTLAKIQNVGLVNGLMGTGGDPKPSDQREQLLAEIRTNNIPNPNEVMASDRTSLVLVSALIPPAAKKGDRVDLVVKTSEMSNTSSLCGGWLMPTALREFRTLGGQVKPGSIAGNGKGELVTEAELKGLDTPESKQRGVIPGGGVMLQTRNLALMVKDEYSHVSIAAGLTKSINRRFSYFDGVKPAGVAKPTRDDLIIIELDPKYRHDPFHYMQVLMSIGFNETDAERAERIELCRLMLQEPTTARRAAMQLEAIGKEGIPTLYEGMLSGNEEVRFYCAHALGYLNDARCIDTLELLAISQPAFRAMCFNALVILDHFEAHDALTRLLQVPDSEVRYGALCALRHRDPQDPTVTGQSYGDKLRVVEIATNDAPQVIVSLSELPQVVIFGSNPTIRIANFMRVNKYLLVKPTPEGLLRVTRFEPGAEERQQLVPSDLRGLIEGLSGVKAGYGEIVAALAAVSKSGEMSVPLVIDPRPLAGRQYDRTGKNIISTMPQVNEEESAEPLELVDPDFQEMPEEIGGGREYGWWDVRRYFTSDEKTTTK